jgi:YXWGXW repeat-containing protein
MTVKPPHGAGVSGQMNTSSWMQRKLVRQASPWIAAAALAALFNGCAAEPVHHRRTVYVEQPAPPAPAPEVVYTQPQGAEIVIAEAPPPPRREVISVRPSRGHVWIAGHYQYQNHGYVWIPGRWELPPRGHAKYVQPRWEHRGRSWVFIEGSWR